MGVTVLQEDVDFLAHYGVKGMRWGVINEDQSSGKTLTKQTTKQTDHKLTDRQKKILKRGVIVTAGVLAAYGTYHLAQSGQMNRMMMKGSAFVNRTPVMQRNEALTGKLSFDQIAKTVVPSINPNYGGPGTKINCRRATYAYEMRRRGFDVAATRTTNGRGQDLSGVFNAMNPGTNLVRSGKYGMMSEVYEEALKAPLRGGQMPFTDFDANVNGIAKNMLNGPGRILEALNSQPEGARGELGLTWRPGGGHSVAWEIIGGKPVIFDGQTGTSYKSVKDMLEDFGEENIGQVGYTRLDNIPLNEDFLLRWVKNAA